MVNTVTTNAGGTGQSLAFSAAELADRFSVSLRHIRRMDSAGKLPRPIRLGASVRWPVAEIEAWLAAGAPDRRIWEQVKGAEGDHRTINALHVLVNFDGGSRGNPGPAGAGVVIRDARDKSILYQGGIYMGEATCNVAEYTGLIHGLGEARHLKADKVDIFGDSMLVIRQMTGDWRCKSSRLKPHHRRAVKLADGFEGGCNFHHVPREENTAADKLANGAMDTKANVLDAADLCGIGRRVYPTK